MPLHDWTRVTSGTWHNFHLRWIAAITDRLNDGMLPDDLFAMAEQKTGGPEPDVVTLSARERDEVDGGGVAVAPPKASVIERAETITYARKTNRIAIHHALGKVVAVIELVSPGNKDTKHALRSFARKAAAFVRNGVHLLVVDVFPPGRYDPHGIHRAIWENVTSTGFALPLGKPLTVASYHAGNCPTAYIEPTAVGLPLPDMALFLAEEFHVTVPLDDTYRATWDVQPAIIRSLVADPSTMTV